MPMGFQASGLPERPAELRRAKLSRAETLDDDDDKDGLDARRAGGASDKSVFLIHHRGQRQHIETKDSPRDPRAIAS